MKRRKGKFDKRERFVSLVGRNQYLGLGSVLRP